ncbi:MAG: HDIG domain-containing protein [Selenomonadaceae bacterium]|nr:HDIG domain-containing protein [Selenomonadaceae bacterium]
MSVFGRVLQFIRAVTARVSVEDGKYISTHLNAEEQKIFFAMSVADQVHSLRTAYTVERLIIEDKRGVDREFLIRCALLHDVGRRNGDLTIKGKIFAVLITSIAPKFAERLELNGNHALYVYHNHAEIGARKLQKLGLFKEAKIIAKHHAKPKPDDPFELKLLRLADNEN